MTQKFKQKKLLIPLCFEKCIILLKDFRGPHKMLKWQEHPSVEELIQ